MTVNDIPNQSKFVALPGSLYLFMDQATRPPTQPKPTRLNSMGNAHQAQEVRSTDTRSLLSLGTGVPHSGQNNAFREIREPQDPQECKDLPQNWQKVASGVDLPHLGQRTWSAMAISRYNQSGQMSMGK